MSRKRSGIPIHGWLNIDKPVGLSSAAVVARVRKALGAAKAGHGGTLDPLASGILPIALGEATKTVSWVMDGEKTYRFRIRWGEARTTDDCEGDVCATSLHRPEREAILAALPATPEPIKQALDGMTVLLDESRPRVPLDLPTQFDTAGDQAALVYPVKQMLKATHMIRQELLALADPLHAPPVAAAAS